MNEQKEGVTLPFAVTPQTFFGISREAFYQDPYVKFNFEGWDTDWNKQGEPYLQASDYR